MAQGIFNLKQVNQAIRQGAWSGTYAPTFVEYLVVAGGGGGQTGGGGGAGGLLTGMVPVTAGASYTVTVGGGGSNGGGGAAVQGVTGTSSVFGSITATGGGGGASYNGTTTGKDGGSGGGGYSPSAGGQGTANQGNAGAGGNAVTTASGGGGGAGSMGLNPLPANGTVGTAISGGGGGAGVASAISGAIMTYAGGGGGGASGSATLRSNGGIGGGGLGCLGGDALNTTGTVNTGGGGGGGFYVNSDGKAGGSGIVIVRYPGTVQFYTGGTVNYANGYIIHTFYANGTLAPTTPTQYSNTYQISRSLRFNSADSTSLTRTPGSATNQKTWTWSAWLKLADLSNTQYLFYAGDYTTHGASIRYTGGYLVLAFYTSSGYDGYAFYANNLYRDPSAWYHFVFAVDTTQANDTNRIKFYVNDVQVTPSALSAPAQNYNTTINKNVLHGMGGAFGAFNNPFIGYMTDAHLIDGQQLTPSSFGEYDVNTGVWIPRSYGGSYGTNGFKLNFSDNSNVTAATLGADSSGNGNNWTPNNFSVTAGVNNDSMVDTPTPYGTDTGVGGEVRGNYATLSLVDKFSAAPVSNGGLFIKGDGGSGQGTGKGANSTIGIPSGKFYWEIHPFCSVSMELYAGIWSKNAVTENMENNASAYYFYLNGGGAPALLRVVSAGSFVNYASYYGTYTNGDIWMFAYDADTGNMWHGKNGSFYNNASGAKSPSAGTNPDWTGIPTGTVNFPHISGYQDGIYVNANINFGQRAFAYTAPTGFKALCTTNLPTPTIGATAATQANKFFTPTLFTGTGAAGKAVTVGFQPDFTWVKDRVQTGGYHHILQDAVRGANKVLYSNLTNAEVTASGFSFTSTGFTVGTGIGDINVSGSAEVAWNWRASNATAVTNTDGSITSTISANPTAGFSIVTYTNASSGTVGHGLGVAPAMVIYKDRTNAGVNWIVLHQSLTNMSNYYLKLNLTDAVSSGITLGGSPTSSVIYTNTNLIQNGAASVAYCFAPVAGYSAFGSYIANASADGPFIHTGFRPAFIMLKRYSSAGAPWTMIDATRNPYNAAALELDANVTSAEYSAGSGMDILSNGFKLRDSSYFNSASADTFIYMAFASTPFKYGLAR